MTYAEQIASMVNGLRMQSGSKTFTRQEIIDALKKWHLSNNKVTYLMSAFQKFGILHSRKVKQNVKEYWWDKEPIHHKKIETVLQSLPKITRKKSPALTEDACVEYLKGLGYQISRPKGLDINKVKKLLGDQISQCYLYESI